MSKSLSPDAIEALRRPSDSGGGLPPPQLASSVIAEWLASGRAAAAGGGEMEITCSGRPYLSGDCD